MRLLLDTHVLLWWLAADTRLGAAARAHIADPATLCLVSAATAWEIAIKTALGRVDLGEPPEVSLPREIAGGDFLELPITIAHALAVGTLPAHHRDPFDRLLVAQARVERLQIVTADRVFAAYDVALLPAAANS